MSGNVPAIKLMIENGIQINHIDKDKHSAVHWAVVCGQLEALVTLLESGAKVDCVDNQACQSISFSPVGAQAVHYVAAAEDICLERCEAMLHVLLKYGAKVNARDIDGRTPILWAATYGNLEIAIILSQTGGDIYAVDRDQLGTIHCAASHGHAHIIEYLISTLDPSIVDSMDRNGDTALFYAVTLGHYECARLLLLSGAEANHQDRHLRCPAHCAAAKGQLRMLKLLKHFGGSCEIQNRRGDLPVHEAIQTGAKARFLDCVEYLLALHPSSINASNHEGRTGLHLAAASGNMEMVILLCTRNAVINPLMLFQNRSDNIVEMYAGQVDQDKGICSNYVNIFQDTLLTPLDLAAQKNHELIVEYLRLRQGAKLAEELSEETRRQTKSHLKHRILEEGIIISEMHCIFDPILNLYLSRFEIEAIKYYFRTIESFHSFVVQTDKEKDGIASDGNRPLNPSRKLTVGDTQNAVRTECVCKEKETQTSIRVCRVAATNTSRPESRDNTSVLKTYRSTSPVQQLVPKAISVADLEQYLPVKRLQVQFEKYCQLYFQRMSGSLKNVHHKKEQVREVDDEDLSCNNNKWTSEDDDSVIVEDANRKKGKSSRNILNKSRSGCDLQSKQLKESGYLRGKSEREERIGKKFVQITRADENLSDNDNDYNGKQVNDNPESSKRSIAAMNTYHNHRSQKASKSADKDDFEKKLEKSLGSLQVDIYRTELGEVTMQQKFHQIADKRIGQCYAHEEAIFNELTHLKKMQLQYGKVKEQVLVRSLINNFCKMYNLNSAHFKFNTFHAWEKFLCGSYRYKTGLQRKQIYQDNKILSTITEDTRSAHSDSSVLYAGEKRCNCLCNKQSLL
uniref:ANK_REP_REGION domain-containing protein n=1 Tax=Elaeophora elaphi TaxID=1147741 RepID=A0A158Q6W0_9BILA